MNSVRINQGKAPLVGGLVAVVAVLAGIAWWRGAQPEQPASSSASAQGASAALSLPAISASSATEQAAEPAPVSAASEAEIKGEQEAVNQEVQKGVIPPIVGPVAEKPAFLSKLEWDMLKEVANREPSATEALTRMVNTTLFYKQLEYWQSLPATDAPQRQALANRLLEDLPQRLRNEDLDLPGAQKMQQDLLKDAEPDQKARAARAKKESQRLAGSPSP